MIMMRKNSDNSLKMFEVMMTSLKNIESTNHSKTSSTKSSSETSNNQTQPGMSEIQVRKGIMFTSSIGLDTDIKRYKGELNAELKVIPTIYIEENSAVRDPDAYLGCMVNQRLRGKTGYSFAIIATGSNDITDLNTDTKNKLFSY